jgi:predicted Fe-Mo cluster-binding NifX family protein
MKIAISSTGPGLSDLVDPRFSRCRYYIFYDTGTGSYESKENTAGIHCVTRGTATGNLVAGEYVDCVLTGHIGPKAMTILKGARVRIFVGISGLVKAAIEACQSGQLEDIV